MTLAYEDSVVTSYPVRSRASTGHRPFSTPIAVSPPSSTERSCIDATPIQVRAMLHSKFPGSTGPLSPSISTHIRQGTQSRWRRPESQGRSLSQGLIGERSIAIWQRSEYRFLLHGKTDICLIHWPIASLSP